MDKQSANLLLLKMFSDTPTLYVIEASVASVEHGETYTSIQLQGCVVYPHNEEVLIKDSHAIGMVESLSCSIKNQFLKYSPIDVSNKFVYFLALCTNTTCYIQSNSRVAESLSKVNNTIKYVETVLNSGRDIKSSVNEAERSIDYFLTTSLKFNFIPVDITRTNALQGAQEAQERLNNLIKDYVPQDNTNTPSLGAEELVETLCNLDTERTGLQSLYVENASSSDSHVYVTIEGSLSKTQLEKSTDNIRITFRDVVIRSYDPCKQTSECEVVDRLDHLNVFVDPKTLAYIQTMGDREPLLGRLIFYRRRDNETNNLSFDFSVRLKRWAPVPTWFDVIESNLSKWNTRLDNNNLLKSRKYQSNITSLLDILANTSNLFFNPNETSLELINNTTAKFNGLYQETLAKYESLCNERDKDQAVHDLTMDAIEYLSNTSLSK